MKAYGKKKTRSHLPGHQECGICHPTQKNKKTRARQAGKVKLARCRNCRGPIEPGEEVFGAKGVYCSDGCGESYEFG